MKTIEFSEQEINTIIQLLDLATKAGGLQVAQAALAIVAKLQAPPKAEPTKLEAVG